MTIYLTQDYDKLQMIFYLRKIKTFCQPQKIDQLVLTKSMRKNSLDVSFCEIKKPTDYLVTTLGCLIIYR